MKLLVRLFAGFVGLLPESWMLAWANMAGTIWFSVVRYRRRVIVDNLARAFPDRTEAERRALGRKACVHLVRTLLEFLRIDRYRREGLDHHVRVDGLENHDAARAKGKGVICLSGHLGSFELAVAAVSPRAEPVSLVVKPFPPGVDEVVNGIRRRSGLGVISAAGALRPVIRALKKNESVVFVLDQNATRSIGVFVDFFGKTACTMSALAVLAMRTGAPVIAATAYREPDGQNVLRVWPEIEWEDKGDRDETIRHMTQKYTRLIEDAIREHPEQWFWTHKRWRTQPK